LFATEKETFCEQLPLYKKNSNSKEPEITSKASQETLLHSQQSYPDSFAKKFRFQFVTLKIEIGAWESVVKMKNASLETNTTQC